jgi:carotenoid 1,2-hydratase
MIRALPAGEPSFRRAITQPGGYAWWYVDALTPSGDGVVCILFLGSVFSPLYAARCRRGERAMPLEHCGVNLALYRGGRRIAFVMSEYPRAGSTDPARLAIGDTTMRADGAATVIALSERTMPTHGRLLGTIRIEPLAPPWPEYQIADDAAGHAWRVLAPRARIRAEIGTHRFALDGEGYFDHNAGSGRLEASFARWSWARAAGPRGLSIVYQLVDRRGGRRAFRFDERPGEEPAVSEGEADPAPFERSLRWGMRLPSRFGPRGGWRCEPGETLDVAPFYARYRAALVDPDGARASGLGEHIDFDRFGNGLNLYLMRWMVRPLPLHPFHRF